MQIWTIYQLLLHRWVVVFYKKHFSLFHLLGAVDKNAQKIINKCKILELKIFKQHLQFSDWCDNTNIWIFTEDYHYRCADSKFERSIFDLSYFNSLETTQRENFQRTFYKHVASQRLTHHSVMLQRVSGF